MIVKCPTCKTGRVSFWSSATHCVTCLAAEKVAQKEEKRAAEMARYTKTYYSLTPAEVALIRAAQNQSVQAMNAGHYMQVVNSLGRPNAISPPPAPKPLPSAGMKVEDLIGWRIWRLRCGYLAAFSQEYAWVPGGVEEGTPGDHDHVGIWAFKTRHHALLKLLTATTGTPRVWGSVKLWGSVVEHAEGYRASKARIVSLEGATDNVTDEAFERLCRRYGVSKEQNS